MTQEELEKKAEEYAEKQSGVFRTIHDHIKLGYIAGAKENRVVWHDLRKSPNDLPITNTNVIVKTNSITESAVFHKRLDGTYFWNCSFSPIERHPESVIAWCELPKFEVKE